MAMRTLCGVIGVPVRAAAPAPGVANWQYSNVSQVGLLNLPVLAVDGWFDGGYNRGNFVRFQTPDTMGGNAAGLWSHQGHSYAHFEKLPTFRRILATEAADAPMRCCVLTFTLKNIGATDVAGTATILRMDGVGYNAGLVGVARPVVVKAGKTVSVPLLVARADRASDDPEIKLEDALTAVRNDPPGEARGNAQ
ncbi:MAG: hypothetical protein R6V58_13635 [Planctomycetota bacterium]